MLSGHNVIGIDIDPLSCLIAKVKTTNINTSELNKVSDWLVKGIKKKKRGEFKPECETIGHWFPKETINKLSIIRTLINQIPERFGDNIGIKQLDNKIQKVFKADKKNGHKHAYITFKYFAGMENHFSEISKCLDKGRHYIMVVGDSSVSNVSFNTADFLTEIAERNGFIITNKWGYKIKNRYMRFDRNGRGGLIDIDWVLDLVGI